MLLKGDVTTTVHKRGSRPRHAGAETSLASYDQLCPRVPHAALDSLSQTRLLYLCNVDETAQGKVNVYRSRSNDRLRVKWISIQ